MLMRSEKLDINIIFNIGLPLIPIKTINKFPLFPKKSKTPNALTSGVHTNKLGGDLLSHGNLPHYHRHNSVSLLSSVWNQVGPPHYRRQKSVDDILLFLSYLFLFISLSSSN